MVSKIKKQKPVKVRDEKPEPAVSVGTPPPAPVPIPPPFPPHTDGPIPIPTEGDTTAFIRREMERYDGDTAIKLYLREIGQVKLLTPLEEIELAARIKKGDKKAREQ